jgi:glutathione S-transferase
MNWEECKLIGSLTSPYVRRLRLLLWGKDFQFESINYLEKNDSEYLKSINPINKIPVWIENCQSSHPRVIYDSRVIFNHLTKECKWTPLSIEEENLLSAIDGLLETSVNLFSLQRAGLDVKDGKNAYLVRQWERIDLIFEYLRPQINHWVSAKTWNYLSISLYSYLDWARFRGVIRLEAYPEMENFLKLNSGNPGVLETGLA